MTQNYCIFSKVVKPYEVTFFYFNIYNFTNSIIFYLLYFILCFSFNPMFSGEHLCRHPGNLSLRARLFDLTPLKHNLNHSCSFMQGIQSNWDKHFLTNTYLINPGKKWSKIQWLRDLNTLQLFPALIDLTLWGSTTGCKNYIDINHCKKVVMVDVLPIHTFSR